MKEFPQWRLNMARRLGAVVCWLRGGVHEPVTQGITTYCAVCEKKKPEDEA